MNHNKQHIIHPPLTDDVILNLRAGDAVLISGIIYTARDAAHKRMVQSLKKKTSLPIPLKRQIIYYAGPAPARPGQVIGPVGPTTAGRMDVYTSVLLNAGLKGMIGKGGRSPEVIESIQKNHAVYFGAIGGAAVLFAQCVREAKVVAYEDLGPEAIRRLVVEAFPVVVVNDCYGGDLYKTGRETYRRENDKQ